MVSSLALLLYFDPQLQRLQSRRSKLVRYLRGPFEDTVTAIYILCQPEADGIFADRLIQLPVAIGALLLSPIVALAYAFYYTLVDLLGNSTSFPANATHVPTFYVPSRRYSAWVHIVLLTALGSIFGFIHCGGWNFPFPTYAAQTLWRVASLVVTIMPIATLPLVLIIAFTLSCCCDDEGENLPDIIAPGVVTLIYASARLILLIQAIALLTQQPPSAFVAVDWTRFYPHIF